MSKLNLINRGNHRLSNVRKIIYVINIRYQEISFTDYKKLVSKQLGISFNLDNPYKLCDIKPALGLIHQDALQGYDFWGFCDIDLIFGNIRSFFPDEKLDRYDFFSAYERRASGHFFLTRNRVVSNSAFMKASNWQVVFEDKEHRFFDEKAFSDLFVRFKSHPGWSRKFLTWLFLPQSRKALFEDHYSTPGFRYQWIDGSHNFPTEWYWNDGKLTNNASDREFLYFHFLKWKRDWAGKTYADKLSGDSWVISADGIHCRQ